LCAKGVHCIDLYLNLQGTITVVIYRLASIILLANIPFVVSV